jgi:hypothetical protein
MKANALIIILIMGMLAGCRLETDAPTVPKRVELTFKVNQIGEPLAVSDDTLVVEEFKFIVRKFNLITVDSETLQTTEERQSFIFGYNPNIQGERLILGVDIGFEDFDAFSGYEVFVDQARGEDNLLDQDFYDDPENYSIIITGTFNRDTFFFTSTFSFEKSFEFDQLVHLDDNNETLWINTLLDLEDLFIDPGSGTLLDPLDGENYEEIVTRFQNQLMVEATAASYF